MVHKTRIKIRVIRFLNPTLGSEKDFNLRSGRRRRKKRSTREGDSIFISIEGHESDGNLRDHQNYLKTRGEKSIQQPIIKGRFFH